MRTVGIGVTCQTAPGMSRNKRDLALPYYVMGLSLREEGLLMQSGSPLYSKSCISKLSKTKADSAAL